jgi:hypothetical protein
MLTIATGVADLLSVAQFVQQFDQRLGGIALVPSIQKLLGQRLASSWRAVGHGRRGKVRIAFAIERRAQPPD